MDQLCVVPFAASTNISISFIHSSATICNPQMEGKELVDKLMDNSSTDKSRELFYKMIAGEEYDLAMMISTGGSDIL